MLGHGMGAAGALELAATALAGQPTIPSTANFEEPDPICDLDCVPNVACSARIRVAMSTSFAFGGLTKCRDLARATIKADHQISVVIVRVCGR